MFNLLHTKTNRQLQILTSDSHKYQITITATRCQNACFKPRPDIKLTAQNNRQFQCSFFLVQQCTFLALLIVSFSYTSTSIFMYIFYDGTPFYLIAYDVGNNNCLFCYLFRNAMMHLRGGKKVAMNLFVLFCTGSKSSSQHHHNQTF